MDQSEILKEPVYSPVVLDFLAVAQKYCLFIEEEAEKHSENEIFDYLHKALPLLYVRGSILPLITPVDPSANEKYVTAEQWEAIFNKLRAKLPNSDIYWFIENDNPLNDIVKGSLSDNLADIYQDLKDFVILYQKPLREAKKIAVHEISHLFKSHWGFRVVNALKVIHYLSYKDYNNRASDNFSDLFV